MDYLLLFNIIFYCSLTSTGVALLLGSVKPFNEKNLRYIWLILLISFAADLTIGVTSDLIHIHVPYIGSTYRLLELIIVLEFYFRIFPTVSNRYITRILQIGSPILFLFILKFEATPIRIANSILFSFYSIAYFRKMMVEMTIPNPTKYPLFWINSAILLYFSGVLFLFLFFEPLARVNESSAVISYMFHNLLLVLKNILFAIGFWKSRPGVVN